MSKFFPNKDCEIQWRLYKKGTTDLASTTDYPNLQLSDYSAHDGNVKVSIDYSDHTYRELFEQTDPEFDIVAQGKEPGDSGELSPVSVTLPLKIKFRVCLVDAPAAA